MKWLIRLYAENEKTIIDNEPDNLKYGIEQNIVEREIFDINNLPKEKMSREKLEEIIFNGASGWICDDENMLCLPLISKDEVITRVKEIATKILELEEN